MLDSTISLLNYIASSTFFLGTLGLILSVVRAAKIMMGDTSRPAKVTFAVCLFASLVLIGTNFVIKGIIAGQ